MKTYKITLYTRRGVNSIMRQAYTLAGAVKAAGVKSFELLRSGEFGQIYCNNGEILGEVELLEEVSA